MKVIFEQFIYFKHIISHKNTKRGTKTIDTRFDAEKYLDGFYLKKESTK